MAPSRTSWFEDLSQLDSVDWNMVYQRYWADNINDMDRQRRKQAEFLIHQLCPWNLIGEIAVINPSMQTNVQNILSQYPAPLHRPVAVRPNLYY